MKICLAGQGAFGIKHLEAIQNIPGIEVVISLAGGRPAAHRGSRQEVEDPALDDRSRREPEAARRRGGDPRQPDADARRSRPIQCMRAGKHVLIEIPIADTLADSERDPASRSRRPASSPWRGHVRRFNPSHQWVHKKIKAGELKIQQMDVQTYFFRRTNMNAPGQPRSWTDHLLWHHACHTVDLFQYQTGELPSIAHAVQGPLHPELEDRDGYEHPAEGAVGRDPAPCRCRSTITGRSARSSATSATTAPTSPVTTIWSTARTSSIDRVEGRRVDERHRAPGPRVLRRDQGKARAQFERAASASTAMRTLDKLERELNRG